MNEDSPLNPIVNEIVRPIEELGWVFINAFWGNESTFEDIILLVGTLVAFIAFILWCCFPVIPKDGNMDQHHNTSPFRNYNSDVGYNQIDYENRNATTK